MLASYARFVRVLCVALAAVAGIGCSGASSDTPAGGGQGGSSGDAGASGGGTAGVMIVAPGLAGAPSTTGYPTSCDDLGDEPVIPSACATLVATRAAPGGVLAVDDGTLDTSEIQDAIDGCPAGQAVQLSADGDNSAFVTGTLHLRDGVTLWVDTGVTLFASHDPRDFDAKPGLCGGNNTGASSCFGVIDARNLSNAAVMGEGTIDGRGGEPVAGTTTTWWDLERAYDGSLAAPRLVQVSGSQNFTLYKVHLKNPGKFHVVIDSTLGFTVWGTAINTPANAPNTDGIDPAGSSNGLIAYNTITTGDDNVALKGSGPGAINNVIIAHNHFGRGHGMSIGSETYGGVQNVQVCDLSLDGTQNGLRIKSDSSRGGPVLQVSYSDVCMRNVRNPFVFDPYYSSATGTLIPNYRDISLRNVHVLGGGNSTLQGWDAAHPLTISLDNVVLDTPDTAMFDASQAQISVGPGPVNFVPLGPGVSVTGEATGSDPPRVCDDAWVTF